MYVCDPSTNLQEMATPMADAGSHQNLSAASPTVVCSIVTSNEQAKTGGLQSKLPDSTELESNALLVSSTHALLVHLLQW